MTRTKKFLVNSLTTAFYQIIVMIAGFITPRVMLVFYGSEINGLISSISQFIAYFNLVEAGLSGAAVYALYKPLADNDSKAINGVVSATNKFYIQAGYIFVSMTIGLAFLYPVLIEAKALSPISIGILVLILGVNGALEFFTMAKYRVLLTADQKVYVVSIASIVHIVINTLIIVVFANLKVDIVILRLIALLSIFLRSFILIIYVKRKYKFINYKGEPNKEALNKRWDALYLQLLGAVQSGAPIIILTVLVKNLKLVSVYAIYNMVMMGVNGILSIFISGLSASFGDVIAKSEHKTLQSSYSIFEFAYYALVTAVYSITFITIMPFIRIYTSGITDADYDVSMIGFLFVLNGLLYNLKTPQGMLVISAGMYRETKVQSTIQALIIVIVGIVLASNFGIEGTLVASILSNLYRDIDLLYFVPKNLTKLPIKTTFFRIIRVFLSVGIICLPFKWINPSPGNYFEWSGIAIGVAIYSVIIVVAMNFIFDREEFSNTTEKIKFMLSVNK